MKHTMYLLGGALAAGLTISAVPGVAQEDAPMKRGGVNQAEVQRMSAGWAAASREAIKFMTGKYGPPAAVTADMAVWGKTGPWKRTVVYATEYPHEFPAHHTDVMQQWIDYRAPADRYDDLARYDGSVVLERTSGEISARCDKEGANFLALNLAHDIVAGKRDVAEARKMYGEQVMAMKAQRAAPYTEKLLFQVPSGTGDPDRPLAADRAGSSRP